MALVVAPPLDVEVGWWSTSVPGDRCVVFFDGDDVYHERWMIWPMGESQWMILTPDGDIYAERLDGSRPDDGPIFSRPVPPDGFFQRCRAEGAVTSRRC